MMSKQQRRLCLVAPAAAVALVVAVAATADDPTSLAEQAAMPETAAPTQGANGFYDLWDTGIGTRLDDDGRVVYVVKSRFRPHNPTGMHGQSSWGSFQYDQAGYAVPHRRSVRRSTAGGGSAAASSTATVSRSTTRAAPRSAPRRAPSSAPRHSSNGASRPSRR